MVTQEIRIKVTYDDYAKTPEDERWELLDGELIMAAAPNMKHQSVQSNTDWHVQRFVRDRDLGRVFNAPTDVVLSEHDVVQPDLVFVSSEREHIITDANIQGAPDLVVEILSPSTASRDWPGQARPVCAAWRGGVLAGGSRFRDRVGVSTCRWDARTGGNVWRGRHADISAVGGF